MKTRMVTLIIIIALILPLISCIVTSRDIHVEISSDDFMENPYGSYDSILDLT